MMITRSIFFPVIQSSVRYAFADILYLFDMDAENTSHCDIVRNLIRDTEERRKVCLKRPSDAPLGLIVAEPKENQALLVLQRESDVIQTWNRQNPHLQIEVGQGIWEVNGISDDFGGVEPFFFVLFVRCSGHIHHHSYPRRFACFFMFLSITLSSQHRRGMRLLKARFAHQEKTKKRPRKDRGRSDPFEMYEELQHAEMLQIMLKLKLTEV